MIRTTTAHQTVLFFIPHLHSCCCNSPSAWNRTVSVYRTRSL